MSILGEAVLTASVELLLKKLTSSELRSFINQERIHDDLKKWESTLGMISAVLEDAEEKQITSKPVKKWLFNLQNLAYDLEDLLDEFATVALERKLTHQPAKASTSKLRKLIPTFKPQSIKFNVKMRAEMKKITERFQEITAQRNNLDLRENSEARSNKVRDQRPPTTSLPESHVYGREKDQGAIIESLLKEEGHKDGVSVIPILGIGGVGKTTLAQNVYDDDRVKNHFDLKAWACVSDDFDFIRVTKTILLSIAPGTRDVNDLNQLQVELKEKLLGKKLLIVLDDIWNIDYIKWTDLLRPFESSSSRVNIIVTTRMDSISSRVGTLPTYQLTALSYDDCLSLFTHHALRRNNFDEHKDLKEIGEKIANRCKGLPLAAKALGGLLYGNVNCEFWERVLNSQLWNLPKKGSDMILPALKLSYQYLPPHLKRCFAYCSLLPKDYEFEKEEIILLWMAQGFLQQECSQGPMEYLGDEYFRELQSRSFFQQSSKHSSRYVMHDLVNDLAQWVAGEIFFFRMDNTVDGVKRLEQNKNFKNLRHLSYVGGMHDGIQKFEAFYDDVNGFSNLSYNGCLRNKDKVIEAFTEVKHLRTFLPVMLSYFSRSSVLTHDILNILPKLHRLRALSLNRYDIDELSNAIGDLKQLRYVDLSHTKIHHLPESISSLYNLLTLKLKGCYCLKKLCDVGNLINLRYLNTSGTALEEMPLNIGKLTSLRMLSDFVVSCSGPGLKALKLLKHLRGTLRISRLENINDIVDAKEADLSGKRDLRVLLLQWSNSDSRNEEMESQVLDMLRPNQKLEQLTINSCRGISLPAWLGDTSFSNLVLLSIEDCCSISLPSIGQLPSLKELVISGMKGIKRVGPELYGNGCSRPFPSLETLSFEKMEEWEEWISHGTGQQLEAFPHLQQLSIVDCPKLQGIGQQLEAFPHLQQLSIVDCPKLQGRLPEHLPSLKSLVIKSCGELPVSVAILPVGCKIEIDGCKQVQPRTDIDLGSLNPIIFSDFQGDVFQIVSGIEGAEIVGYKAPTSFWHSGIISLQDTVTFFYPLDWRESQGCLRVRLRSLLESKEELQLRGLPSICQYLVLDSVCLTKLPQVLLNLDFLRKICIANCSDLVSFPEATLPSHLRAIDIESCDALQCLPDTWMDCTSLECLSVSRCESLMYLTRKQLFPNLKKLVIKSCKDLKTLIQEENNSLGGSSISATSSFSKSELPATLEHIEIEFCDDLAYLSSGGNNLPKALKYLCLHYCSKLESVAERFHDNTCLKEIHIYYCENLQLLAEDVNKLDHLERITINLCPSLVSFPRGGLPFTNLTDLKILSCQKLVELPDNMHQLSHLQQIQIRGCLSLVSFPAGGFPSTNLTELKISYCEKLETLPNDIYQLNHLQKIEISECEKLKGLPHRMQNLTSLRDLVIEKCGGMESFPEDGFPINLTSLRIIDTPKICERLFQWGLHKLSSLRRLFMGGCPDVMSFPPQQRGILLPTSLIILYIREFPDLKCLSSDIQSLNSLEKLYLENCPKLKSFPEKGLPLSLLELRSNGCPLLKQNCEKHKGRYWPMIAYIPEINMDYSLEYVIRRLRLAEENKRRFISSGVI